MVRTAHVVWNEYEMPYSNGAVSKSVVYASFTSEKAEAFCKEQNDKPMMKRQGYFWTDTIDVED